MQFNINYNLLINDNLKLRNFKLDAVDQFDFWVDNLLVTYSHHKYHTYFVTLLINSAS